MYFYFSSTSSGSNFLLFPEQEGNNYKGAGFAREGGGGIPSLSVHDPLPSTRGPKLAPNGRDMIFMLWHCETLY